MKALVPIADGSEEIEAVSIIDTLRRAGIETTVASVGANAGVEASRGVRLVADCLIADAAGPYDIIALPGGMPGAENLASSDVLQRLVRAQAEGGGLLGAICAAPAVVLEPMGLLKGRMATAHPGFIDRLASASAALESRVVVDGNIVTSRGPGTAIEFALTLVGLALGPDKEEEVRGPMLVGTAGD